VNAPLLKASDVMAALSISRRLVYQMAQDGRLPCVRVGGPDGPLRFRPADIERLVVEWSTGART
jgi:predicted DNA-binding transcriptional regulator AlpA